MNLLNMEESTIERIKEQSESLVQIQVRIDDLHKFMSGWKKFRDDCGKRHLTIITAAAKLEMTDLDEDTNKSIQNVMNTYMAHLQGIKQEVITEELEKPDAVRGLILE